MPISTAYSRSICQTTFSPRRSPETRLPRSTGQKTCPSAVLAELVQESIATFTQFGIGVVRMRPCFPRRSTMHQRPSRC